MKMKPGAVDGYAVRQADGEKLMGFGPPIAALWVKVDGGQTSRK